MKTKFTSLKVQKFPLPSEARTQAFYWDSETAGLSVRVTKNNNRAYIFQGRIATETIRITIGDIKTWSLEEARKEARKFQQLIDQGINPREEKKSQELKSKLTKITFGEVYMEYTEAQKDSWSKRTHTEAVRLCHRGGQVKKIGKGLTLPAVLAPLLDLPLSSISPDILSDWLRTENKTRKTQTATAYRMLRACINWCHSEESYKSLITPEVYKHPSVRKLVYKPVPKKNYIQKHQLKSWFQVVNELDNPIHQALLKVCLLTGGRSEAVRSMKYTDIDFNSKFIHIWNKPDQDYIQIPLTPYVENLIKNLRHYHNSDYIFASLTAKDGYVINVRKQYYRTLKKYNLPIFTIHDLRRSFSNLSEWLDIPVGVVAQIMGHKPTAIAELHYKNRPVDLLRMHHEKIETWILEQAEVSINS